MRYLITFRAWLIAPIMELIQRVHDNEYLSQISIESRFRAIVQDAAKQSGELSLDALMRYEAVAFAADKFQKDAPVGVDREKEIYPWALAYLSENGWPALDIATFRSLLRLNDGLRQHRRVGAHQ